MAESYRYKIINLNEKQSQSILKKIDFAIQNLFGEGQQLLSEIEKADRCWHTIIENSETVDSNTKHTLLNSLGTYLGEIFKKDFSLFEWKLFEDDLGSDLCLYFEWKGKDMIIFPISTLYKGFESKDPDFLKTYYAETKNEIIKWMEE